MAAHFFERTFESAQGRSNCRYRGCRSIDALVSIIRRPIVIGASYIKLDRNISRDIPMITDRILIGGGEGGGIG